jgi:hypothetical protein
MVRSNGYLSTTLSSIAKISKKEVLAELRHQTKDRSRRRHF